MIEIKDIRLSYRKSDPVLDHLSLSLSPGHIYGLFGSNGAGKTSLMHLMCGLLSPQAGSVSVLDNDPFQRSPALLGDLFLLPDEVKLPAMPVQRYAEIYAAFYPNFERNLFDRLLTEFEVSAEAKLDHLSYGQRKKVLIAFSIAARTKVLLLDEPTNGLDIPSKRQFRKVMAECASAEQVIVISTHQAKDLENLIDFILVLADKRIIVQESVYVITEKLAFRQVMELAQVPSAIYSEGGLKGYAVVAENTRAEATRFDTEMFFNALIAEKEKMVTLLNRTSK